MIKRTITRTITATAIAALLTVQLALPALAATETGSLNCGADYLGTKTYADGTVRHYVPATTQVGIWTWTSPHSNTSTTFYSSNSWKTSATGYYDYGYSGGFCWGS